MSSPHAGLWGAWGCPTRILGGRVFVELCQPVADPAPATPPAATPPTPQDQPVTITVTASQVASLIVGGSGITRSPDTTQVPAGYLQIAYTDPTPRDYTLTLGHTDVTVHATPVFYTWDWGDNTTPTPTTDPGTPWPTMTLTHCYTTVAPNLVMTLTTTWDATFTTPDGTTHPVDGTVTTTSTSTPFNVIRLTSVLTDDAEEARDNHQPLPGNQPLPPGTTTPTPNPLACTPQTRHDNN